MLVVNTEGGFVAVPMTPAELRKALDKWDVKYREITGWDKLTSGRDDETGKPFGPVFGCITHHTGDDAPDSADRQIIINGRSDLPGPLAQFGLNDDGVVDLITFLRANHAGGGDPEVLEAVINESYGNYPPKTQYHEGSPGATDGNDCFYGVETYYSGSHPMTSAQYESLTKLWAAICDHYGWSAKSVIGHKEWSNWKIDPGKVDMNELRGDIQALLDKGPYKQTPNITAAIAANRKYQAALELISNPPINDEVDQYIAALKKEREFLKSKERP
jgi:hypothetical protein